MIEHMAVEDPTDDAPWDLPPAERRKPKGWTAIGPSLLQELRVVQTGVQLLTGLLLTLPFQQRFTILDERMRTVYLVRFACSMASTVLLVAPVGVHRMLFRRHRLDVLVSAAHQFLYAGLILLGVALSGVTAIIFYAVAGKSASAISGGASLIAFTAFWVAGPMLMRWAGRRGLRDALVSRNNLPGQPE